MKSTLSKQCYGVVISLLIVLTGPLLVAAHTIHFRDIRIPGSAPHLDDQSDLSELEISFQLVKGRLKVNRQTSKAVFSNRFDSRLSKSLSKKQVINSLFDDLDKALQELQPVFYYSLPDAIRNRFDQDESFRTSILSDSETSALNSFTSENWSEFQTAFNQWRTNKTATLQPQLLSLTLLKALGTLDRSFGNTPLVFDTLTGAPDDIDLVGKITVGVVDPIGDLTEDDYSIVVPQDTSTFPHKDKISPTVDDIRKALAPLKGQLWRSNRIRSYLSGYFEDSDYVRIPEEAMDELPTLHVDEANRPTPRVIQIGKVRRIARIDLMQFKDEDPATDLVLRQILNDSQFRLFVKKQYGKDTSVRPLHKTSAENLITFHYLYLFEVTGKDQEPHFSHTRHEAQGLNLAKLGYALVVTTYDPDTDSLEGAPTTNASDADEDEDDDDDDDNKPLYLRLLISKRATETPESNVTPTPSPSPSSTNGTTGISPLPSPSPTPTPLKEKTRVRKNYVGAELIYKPDQGVKVNGIYKRLGVLNSAGGQADLSVSFGTRDDNLIFGGNFAGDNLLFPSIRRRLSIDLNGSSDFEAQRIFFNTKTNERRQFSSARVDIEIMTRPRVLSLFVEGRGGTVELIQSDQSIGKQRLNTLGFGGNLVFKTDEVRPLSSLQLEPSIRLGLGLARNEPTFRVLSLRGVFQRYRDVPARVGFQITGRIQLASSRTPLFELPSFGGVESVRGFREDDAIGRRVFSLQSELRTPVFGLAPDAEGLKGFLRSRVKLAGFVDVGGAYQTTGSVPGLRAGPGAGLRVNFQGVNMNFDLAYGLGDAAGGRGRGRFHFSVEAPLPF